MKIELNSRDERSDPGYGTAYVMSSNTPDHLVGKLLTLIEALGLPSGQEKAIKDVVRSEVYSSLTGGSEVWINSALHNLIRDFDSAYRKAPPASAGHPPIEWMSGHYMLTFTEQN